MFFHCKHKSYISLITGITRPSWNSTQNKLLNIVSDLMQNIYITFYIKSFRMAQSRLEDSLFTLCTRN